MAMKTKPAFRFLVFSLSVLALANSAVAEATSQRVVAIGDVHGAYEELLTILQRTGLIDGKQQWKGGSATLVQTGDLMDRGPRVRDCLELLIALERQAQQQRGRVIALLGNHEVMNIMGDLRYATPEIYRSFATAQSEKVRERSYQQYLEFLVAHREHAHTAVATDETAHQKWMEEHPSGFFEYRDAIGPKGKYGRWLRQHHALVQAGDGIFVHGGLNPTLPFRTADDMDAQIRSELASFDSIWQSLSDKKVIWRYMKLDEAVRHVVEELTWIKTVGFVEDLEAAQQMQNLLGYLDWMVISPNGPLWYRGLAEEPEEKLAGPLEAMLVRLKVKYLVSGHTVVSKTEITPRFGNRVFLIDSGMLRQAYQGRASALEILNGRFTAYFADGEPKVLGSPGSNATPPLAALEPRSRMELR